MPKEILRPMWDSRRQLWKVTKKTNNGAGGWSSLSPFAFYTNKAECQDKIDWLIFQYPEQYQADSSMYQPVSRNKHPESSNQP
jgi:hypothetical protein